MFMHDVGPVGGECGLHIQTCLPNSSSSFLQSSWLPLLGAQLQSGEDGGMPRVNTLAWDGAAATLYVGGTFTAGGRETTGYNDAPATAASSGLATWSESTGLQPFSGGGLFKARAGGGDPKQTGAGGGVAFQIAFEPKSTSLFVAGAFDFVGADGPDGGAAPLVPCQNIAVWQRRTNEWRCLFQVRWLVRYRLRWPSSVHPLYPFEFTDSSRSVPFLPSRRCSSTTAGCC